MTPMQTIVLIQVGLASFGVAMCIDVSGEKGGRKYELVWTANALTLSWGGTLWGSKRP
jgi:hypothetical protein